MVANLESRRAARLPLWSVYLYDFPEQYARKLRWFANELRSLPGPGSILDIGCGTGELLRWFDAPPGYLGVDLTPGLIEQARTEHPFRHFGCLNVLSALLEPFDTVAMVGVLGLSPNPLGLIRRAICLAKHNLLFDFLTEKPGHRNETLDLQYLSVATVDNAITDGGLTVVRSNEVGANVAVVAKRASHVKSNISPKIHSPTA